MKLALVGVGGAGRRIVDAIRGIEADGNRRLCYGNLLTVDISRTVDDDLDHVPQGQRVTIGDTHREVDDGVDGDQDLAVEISRTDLPEVRRELDSITMRELDGVLVVAGLGGGTGSGAGAVLVEELQGMYDKPVYALGVLPRESEGDRAARNAARALRSIVPMADSTMLLDNDRWLGDDPTDDDYARVNRELATRIVTLFAIGDLGPSTIGANTMDSSDIIRTLAPGGVASIGYASTDLDTGGGLLSWLRSLFPGDRTDGESAETTDAVKIQGLIRRALGSRLTLPCEVSSAERVLVVLSGPPSELSRRGFESARQWLEEETETVEVHAGDDPREGASSIAAVVLLSNVTEVPRIDAMQRQAVGAHDAAADRLQPSDDSG